MTHHVSPQLGLLYEMLYKTLIVFRLNWGSFTELGQEMVVARLLRFEIVHVGGILLTFDMVWAASELIVWQSSHSMLVASATFRTSMGITLFIALKCYHLKCCMIPSRVHWPGRGLYSRDNRRLKCLKLYQQV